MEKDTSMFPPLDALRKMAEASVGTEILDLLADDLGLVPVIVTGAGRNLVPAAGLVRARIARIETERGWR